MKLLVILMVLLLLVLPACATSVQTVDAVQEEESVSDADQLLFFGALLAVLAAIIYIGS